MTEARRVRRLNGMSENMFGKLLPLAECGTEANNQLSSDVSQVQIKSVPTVCKVMKEAIPKTGRMQQATSVIQIRSPSPGRTDLRLLHLLERKGISSRVLRVRNKSEMSPRLHRQAATASRELCTARNATAMRHTTEGLLRQGV